MEELRISKIDLEVLSDSSTHIVAPIYVSTVSLEILDHVDISNEFQPVFVSNYTVEVLHKFEDTYQVATEYDYFFSGTVFEKTLPVSRKLYAFSNSTNKLVGVGFSNTSGDFILPSTISGTCFVVCLADSYIYNHLIAAIVVPTT